MNNENMAMTASVTLGPFVTSTNATYTKQHNILYTCYIILFNFYHIYKTNKISIQTTQSHRIYQI